MSRVRIATALLAVFSLVLAGCGGGAQPTATTAPAKPAEATKPAAASPSPAVAASPSPAGVASPGAAVAKPSPVAGVSPSPIAAASPSPVVAGLPPPAPPGSPKPAVRVGSTNFSEQVILAELYSQVLESDGYRVERRLNLGNREIVAPALESGQIDIYPEYLATALAFQTRAQVVGSSDAAETAARFQEALRPKGISALDYAPGINTNAFAVTRATAERLNLAKMSDLAPVAQQLVLGGPPECPQRPFCLQGLERTYGITFKEFRPLDAGGPLTVAALDGGQVDVALIFSTDAVITQRGFVVLEDDKKLQLADNIVPVVRDELLTRAPLEFRTLINGVTRLLTTEELIDLNRQVGVDRREPRDVAAEWLKSKNLVR